MNASFGEMLRRLRIKSNLSQQNLADMLKVERSTIAKWEGDRHMPDAIMISRLSECLHVDITQLFPDGDAAEERPNVLLVDDSPIVLEGGIPILRQALPNANVVGFTRRQEVLDYSARNPVALALLDIELGRHSGLDLCRELVRIRPRANVIYLTSYREYAFDAWATDACGFLLKPLDAEELLRQIPRLRYPVRGLL